jgi:hypothetical protein
MWQTGTRYDANSTPATSSSLALGPEINTLREQPAMSITPTKKPVETQRHLPAWAGAANIANTDIAATTVRADISS